jgi:hypothetical protein
MGPCLYVRPKPPLQHHLALPCSAASISGVFGRILSIFITLWLLNTRVRAVLFSRSFRISDAVGRYAQKLWIGDFLRDVVYLPFEQSNGSADVAASAGRVHRCKEYTTTRSTVSSLCLTST